MNYIIIIILVALNLITVGYKTKKHKDEVTREIYDNRNRELNNLLNILNIGVIVVNILTIVLSVIFHVKDLVGHIVSVVALLATYILFMMNNKKKEKSSYNIIEHKDKHIYKMIINLVLEIVLIDRVGAIKDSDITSYLSLLAIVFLLINIVHIIKYLNENKAFVKFKARDKDILADINTSLYVETANIFKYATIGIVILLVMFVNIPYSFIAHILIIILLLTIYNSDLNKIKKEKKKLYNNIVDMNQKPGPLYIYQYKRHIEQTKCLFTIILLYVITILSCYLIGEWEFLIIGINIYTIVIYSLLKKKKKTIDAAICLNEELINKDKYKVNIKDEITNIIEYKELLLNINFYKIVFKDQNNNIYISESILYNLNNIYNDINLYINTENMEDYIVVEEEYY